MPNTPLNKKPCASCSKPFLPPFSAVKYCGDKQIEGSCRAVYLEKLKQRRLTPEQQQRYYGRYKDNPKYNKSRYKGRRVELMAYVRDWERRNRAKSNHYKTQTLLKRKGAVGEHTFEEWIERQKLYGDFCYMCMRSEPEIKLTKDHIIPLSKGGTNEITNLQPLCGSCNSRKATQAWFASCPLKSK